MFSKIFTSFFGKAEKGIAKIKKAVSGKMAVNFTPPARFLIEEVKVGIFKIEEPTTTTKRRRGGSRTHRLNVLKQEYASSLGRPRTRRE